MTIKQIPVGRLGTNCYLLCDEASRLCALIDPGDWANQLLEAVEKSDCTLSRILLTHGHYDHHLAVRPILERYPQLPVYIHRADTCPADTQTVHYAFPLLPDENQRFYDEGDTVRLGTLTLKVLHTPGHTAGSVVLQVGGTLFAGDTLFAGSCGRVDLPGGDGQAMMSSLRRLGRLEGDFTVYPGHMESTTLDEERRRNPYMSIALRG